MSTALQSHLLGLPPQHPFLSVHRGAHTHHPPQQEPLRGTGQTPPALSLGIKEQGFMALTTGAHQKAPERHQSEAKFRTQRCPLTRCRTWAPPLRVAEQSEVSHLEGMLSARGRACHQTAVTSDEEPFP